MATFEFTLKFSLPEAESDPKAYIEQLAEAGCDDALVGVGLPGRIVLEFDRESASAFEAISSAIADVRQAIPEAKLVEATPDLVGLTDKEAIPEPIAIKSYSGKFMVRIPPEIHRMLAIQAAESGVSLNRLVSSKLN